MKGSNNKTTTTSSGAFVVYNTLVVESTHTLVVDHTVYTILVVINLMHTLVVRTHILSIVLALLVVRQL